MNFLFLLMLPSLSFAIELPSGVATPVEVQPGSQNGMPTTGSVDEWTRWGESQLEAARKRAAIDYAINNTVAGARCLYSIDFKHPTDTIDVDAETNGYKVTCFATKQGKPDIYVITYHNVVTKLVPSDCANSTKFREHFSAEMNRNPGAIPAFNLKFMKPGCATVVESVASSEAAKLNLTEMAAQNWFKSEMDKRVGLQKPGEKAINASRNVKPDKVGPANEDSDCLANNPLCEPGAKSAD